MISTFSVEKVEAKDFRASNTREFTPSRHSHEGFAERPPQKR